MSPQRRKIALAIFTLVCVLGGGGLIYVGHQLFQNRPSMIFWFYSIYILALTGIVIFFGFRLIGIDPSKGE